MNKKEKLLSLYGNVLKSLRISDETGDSLLSMYLTVDDDESTEIPCLIGENKKRLALPSDDILKANIWNEVIAFHPLSENTLRGESEIIKFIKNQITFNLTFAITNVLQTLAELACNPALQKPLSVKQSRFLELVPDLDEKSLKVITKILTTKFQEFITVYLKREGNIKGKSYRRVTVVNFPIIEEFNTKGSKVFGIDCGSSKKKAQIKALFDFVMDFENDWEFGSNSDIAPYFHSAMSFYVDYAKHLNALVFKYRKYIPNSDNIRVDILTDDWTQYLDQPELLVELKACIPSLEGNAGAATKGEVAVSEETNEPVAAVKRTSISVDDILNRNKTIGNGNESSQAIRQPIQTAPQYQVSRPTPTAQRSSMTFDEMMSNRGGNSNQHQSQQYGSSQNHQQSYNQRSNGLYGTNL